MQETIYRIRVPHSIALLADPHNKPMHAVIKSLETHKPEIIAIPGDLFFHQVPKNGESPLSLGKHALPFLKACGSIAPTFLSLGNHDLFLKQSDFEILRDVGVTTLDNTWIRHGSLCIGGLTCASVLAYRRTGLFRQNRSIFRHSFLGRSGKPAPLPELGWLDDFEAQNGFKLLLCHHPEYYPRFLYDRDLDLILSGHAHGGQIRLFGQGLFAPGQGWLPKYTAGIHGNMIVSRGLANTGGIIPRLFNPREIVYIEPE